MKWFFLFSFFLCSLTVQCQWIQQPDFPGTARDDATILNTGSGLAFIGTGRDVGFNFTNDWHSVQYGNATSTWFPMASLPASPRQYCTRIGDNLTLLFGGQSATNALNELWEYGPGSNTWNQRASLPDSGRSACASFYDPSTNYGYVVGGILNDGSVSAEVWRYEYLNDNWVQLADFPGTPRHRAMYSENGIIAGGADLLFTPLADCWQFDFPTETWTQTASLPYPIYGGASTSVESLTVVAGGVSNGGVYTDSLFVYDPVLSNWSPVTALPGARKGACMVHYPFFAPGLYFGLGIDSTNLRYNDWWYFEYNPNSIGEITNEPLLIHPNPASSNIQIPEPGIIELFDAKGRLLKRIERLTPSTVDVSALNEGLYTIKLHGKYTIARGKVLVLH